MSKIAIDLGSCTRFRSTKSECTLCASACQPSAIEFASDGIKISNSKCTQCFACMSACPSSAVISSSADTLGFTARFLDSEEDTLSCESCGFCIKALDSRTLLTIILLKKTDLKITSNGCEKCADDDFYTSFIDRLNEYAKGFGAKHRFIISDTCGSTKAESQGIDRRGFFAALTGKNMLKAAKSINDSSKDDSFFALEGASFASLREKKVPIRRQGLLEVLSTYTPDDTQLPPLFFTDKIIDESCTNCELCYNLCPTGALSAARLKNAINFESYKCIKCGLCEAVCETKSIHSLPAINIQEFAKKTKKELAKFKVARCYACGAVFTPLNANDGSCPRCAREDEDAMELSGLF